MPGTSLDGNGQATARTVGAVTGLVAELAAGVLAALAFRALNPADK